VPDGDRPDPLTLDPVTAAHLAVEDRLIELRDARISVLGPGNGLVIKERNGADSPIMRMGTREAVELALQSLRPRLERLPADGATTSRDYGRGYAQAIRDVLELLP
jgi:hypothetical protein